MAALSSAGAFVLAGAGPSHALTSFWGCTSYPSALQCYDSSGYHGWIQIDAASSGLAVNEWCAKAQASGGTIKAGSGCNSNATSRVSCLDNVSPNSLGYGYWDGSGGPWTVADEALSPSDATAC